MINGIEITCVLSRSTSPTIQPVSESYKCAPRPDATLNHMVGLLWNQTLRRPFFSYTVGELRTLRQWLSG